MSLLCLAHHARSTRRWPRGETNPVQIRWKFCPGNGQMRTPDKQELPDEQKSRHQDNVSRSTLEAECVVASQAGQEALSCSAQQEGAAWLALPTISSGGV